MRIFRKIPSFFGRNWSPFCIVTIITCTGWRRTPMVGPSIKLGKGNDGSPCTYFHTFIHIIYNCIWYIIYTVKRYTMYILCTYNMIIDTFCLSPLIRRDNLFVIVPLPISLTSPRRLWCWRGLPEQEKRPWPTFLQSIAGIVPSKSMPGKSTTGALLWSGKWLDFSINLYHIANRSRLILVTVYISILYRSFSTGEKLVATMLILYSLFFYFLFQLSIFLGYEKWNETGGICHFPNEQIFSFVH